MTLNQYKSFQLQKMLKSGEVHLCSKTGRLQCMWMVEMRLNFLQIFGQINRSIIVFQGFAETMKMDQNVAISRGDSHQIFVDLFWQLLPCWQFFVCSNVAGCPLWALPETYRPAFSISQQCLCGAERQAKRPGWYQRKYCLFPLAPPQISRTPRHKKASG